jgi:hypothetical protein
MGIDLWWEHQNQEKVRHVHCKLNLQSLGKLITLLQPGAEVAYEDNHIRVTLTKPFQTILLTVSDEGTIMAGGLNPLPDGVEQTETWSPWFLLR